MTSRILLTAGAILFALGCGAQQRVDVEAERAAILEADRAFSQTPPDTDAFAAFMTEDGVALGGGAPILRGREAIRASMAEDFGAPGAALQWSASEAEVSACGDLGYSIGTYEQAANDSAGNPVKTRGKYVTVWEKQEDGGWKVAVDAYSDDGPDAVERVTPPRGPDPIEVDPAHYTLEFENDQVRVLRIRYGPGEKSIMHAHPPGVAVFLTDQQNRFTAEDGATTEQTWKAGQASWSEAETHLPENLGDQPMELILVELKATTD